ncbi:MAG: carboxymuconolactone decarboxylase family protein [Pseudomonadota bacterium]
MSEAVSFPAENLTPGVSAQGPLDRAIAEFAAAAVRADRVDPVLTELVRLRCAQYHDCRICASVRTQVALDAGYEESMQAKIANYANSDLSPEIKAALKLTDAMLIDPGAIDPDLAAELAAYFTPDQLVEICVDVMKWSQQKAFVALRIEPPVSDQHLTQLLWDKDGHPIFGEPIRES